MLLHLVVAIQARVLSVLARRGERGQAVAEYALVLLGVAAVALLFGRWASKSTIIGHLLDAVFENLIGRLL